MMNQFISLVLLVSQMYLSAKKTSVIFLSKVQTIFYWPNDNLRTCSGYMHKDTRESAKQICFLLKANHTTFFLPQRQQSQEQPISQYSNSLSEIHISYQNLQFCLMELPENKKIIYINVRWQYILFNFRS